MAGPRPEKVAVVEEVREHLGSSSAAILTEYRGLKVGDLATLRRQLRTAGADYKIFKNTLVRRATADTDRASIGAFLDGPTAIVFVRDDVGPVAKVLRDFGRAHPELIVKGGLLGTQLLDANGATALAELPSRDVLLAQLAGAIAAPMRQFASLLQALPRSLAYGLSALIDKLGGVADTAEVTETVETTETADTQAPEAPESPATDTAQASESTGPTGPADATEVAQTPDEATEPAETREPTDTIQAGETPEPASETAESTETTQATETSEPAEAHEVAESTETTEPTAATETPETAPEAAESTETTEATETTEPTEG